MSIFSGWYWWMEQLELFEIPNPCRGVCESNYRGYCKGCMRSRNERLLWLKMSVAQKRYVLYLCGLRRRKLNGQLQQQIQLVEPIATATWTQKDFDF